VVQCDICQVVNDEMAQFCKECGGRLPVRPQASASPGSVMQIEQPAEPIKKPRPRLKSPILGSSEDDNDYQEDYQDDSSDMGHGSAPAPRKRKGLRSPILGGADDYENDEPDEKPRPRGKGGLRSPMLGGAGGPGRPAYDDDDDDFEETPKPKQSRAKGGLRSPMLGGANDFDDDDDDYSEPPAPVGKGGLRSPILGGGEPPAKAKRKSSILGGGGREPREQKDHIEFPHRSHSEEDDEPHLNARPKGLRSPLLGGDDGDFEEMPEPTRRKAPGTHAGEPHHQPSGRKLRSPILGGADTDDFDDYDQYDDEDDDEYDDEDETVLRSPLLAARSPSKKPKPRTDNQSQNSSQNPSQAPNAPSSGAAPQAQTPFVAANQPQFSSSPAQNPAMAPNAGVMPNAGQAYPPQNYQNPAASQTQLPQMPQTPPRYQPQPAPKPTNSNYRMPEQTLVQLEPLPGQSQPALNQETLNPPALAQPALAPEISPKEPAVNNPAINNKVDTRPQEKLRSRLLASDADSDADDQDYSGAYDRRLMGDRRGTGSRRKSDSFAAEEVESFSTMRQNSTGGAAGMAPVVMALVGLALIAKAWFIFSYLKQDSMLGIATIADQLTTAAALVATIMMASKINRPM